MCLSLSQHASQTNISSFFGQTRIISLSFVFACFQDVCQTNLLDVFFLPNGPLTASRSLFHVLQLSFPLREVGAVDAKKFTQIQQIWLCKKTHLHCFLEETDLKVQLIHICVCCHLFKRVIYRSYFATFIWLRIQPPSNRSLLTPWTPCCFIQDPRIFHQKNRQKHGESQW